MNKATHRSSKQAERGFTLIEIMAVMIIIGVMASVLIKKMNTIGETADLRAIEVGIAELNSREMLTWTNQKFAVGGYEANLGDLGIYRSLANEVGIGRGYNLGTDYDWTPGHPLETGGTISFGSQININLIRTASTPNRAARWSR